MPGPRTTHWDIQPHTKTKHFLLRRYLDAWLPIMATYNGRVIFIDGFAGPGRYKGGEEGSPIIALNALLDHPHFQRTQGKLEVALVFIERDEDRAAALSAELDRLRAARSIPTWVRVHLEKDSFVAVINRLLDALEQGGHRLAPTFAFIDPFGFKDTPLAVIKRIVKNPKCECLITFMYEYVNRFLSHPDPSIQAYLDELFGTDRWRELLHDKNPARRKANIVDLYRQQLIAEAGLKYVRTFEMVNEGNRTEYFLYFGSNSLQGLSKMKESMWRADPTGGQVFSDLTDSNQMVLLTPETDTDHLKRLLRLHFRGRRLVPIEEIQEFVLRDTAYSEAMHLKRRTLAPMEKERLIEVRRLSAKARKGTFPEGTRVTFLS